MIAMSKIKINYIKNFLTFLFIGRFVEQKGLKVLLEALDIVVNRRGLKNLKLRVVGDGEEKSMYDEYIKEESLEPYIEFLGWVKLEDLNRIYNEADVFVL